MEERRKISRDDTTKRQREQRDKENKGTKKEMDKGGEHPLFHGNTRLVCAANA
jgi:hypothetical protein